MKNIGITLVLILFIISAAYGQKKKGDKAYERLEYFQAIEYYNNYLEDSNDVEISIKLAKCYLFTNQFNTAKTKLSLLKSHFNQYPDIHRAYASILLMSGEIEESKRVISEYLQNNTNDIKGNTILKSCNIYDKLNADADLFDLSNSSFGSSASHFSPVFHNDKIFFTSENSSEIDKWTGRPFTMIFETDSSLDNPSPIKGNLNGEYHNGAVWISKSNSMYYTRNSAKKNKNNERNLIIAKANLKGDEWKFEDYFEYNSKEFNTAYPTLSPDDMILIFSSDRPGGYGGMDLYYCKYQNDKWQSPVNMGDIINTYGDEIFPTFSKDENLYFSSNGHAGLGGLDILSTKKANNEWSNPVNIGAPLNSSYDDFGLITNDQMNTGYISTNRNSIDGQDQILRFEKKKEKLLLIGIVVDKYTDFPLSLVDLTLSNTLTGETINTVTSDNGRFEFEVDQNNKYKIEGIKNSIKTTLETIDIGNPKSPENMYVKLLHNDPRFTLNGMTQNVKDKSGVVGVTVKLLNKSKNTEVSEVSDENGDFHFQLEHGTEYEISGVINGFYTSVSEASTVGLDRSTALYVNLFLRLEEVIIGATKIIGKEKIGGWEFDPIYYDLDESFIRPDAALVLDRIKDFLIENSSLKIELGSHTDCRATDEYNLKLSNQRANEAMKYLIQRGISQDRITYKGYGESNLTNHCRDGVECDEQRHQQNRRTEMKVLGY